MFIICCRFSCLTAGESSSSANTRLHEVTRNYTRLHKVTRDYLRLHTCILLRLWVVSIYQGEIQVINTTWDTRHDMLMLQKHHRQIWTSKDLSIHPNCHRYVTLFCNLILWVRLIAHWCVFWSRVSAPYLWVVSLSRCWWLSPQAGRCQSLRSASPPVFPLS